LAGFETEYPVQTESEQEYKLERINHYGYNRSASPFSERRDHARYHWFMDKSKDSKDRYEREHSKSKDDFKEDTKGDEKKRVYYAVFSAGLYAAQHGMLAVSTSQ